MRPIAARHLATTAAALLLIGGLAACGSSGNTAGTAPSGSAATGSKATGGSDTSATDTSSATGNAAGGTSDTSASAGTSTDNTAAGNSSGGTSSTDSGGATSVTPAHLVIRGNAVDPATLTVSPGQTIDITNSDAVAHTLVDTKDNISSGTIKAKGTGTLTAPTTAGTYRITDPHHTGTHLTLVVN